MLRRKSELLQESTISPAGLVQLVLEAHAWRRKADAVGSRGAPSVLLTDGAVRNERLRRYILRLSAHVLASDQRVDQLARDFAKANARLARLQREAKQSSAYAESMLAALQAQMPVSPRAAPLTPGSVLTALQALMPVSPRVAPLTPGSEM